MKAIKKFIFNFLRFFNFPDAERSYRSDCETDDGISVANDGEFMNGSSSQQLTNHSSKMKNRSPLGMRQSSPFPNEMTNRRMQQYNNAQERLRNGEYLFGIVFKFWRVICEGFKFIKKIKN